MTTQVDSKTEFCPNCNTRWFSTPIPEQYHEFYSPPYFYSRLIGISDFHLDRVVEYVCPDCDARFERK